MCFHFLGCDFRAQHRVIFIIIWDKREHQCVAFIARTTVRYIKQFHDWKMFTCGEMLLRSINVDTMPRTSVTYFLAPPPPAGPLVYKASISSPIKAACSGVDAFAAIRSLTS